MRQLATILTAINQAKASGQELQSSNPPKNSVTLKDDPDGRRELSNFLFQCFDTLKVYGKEPEQMKNLNSVFQVVLADYPFEKIRAAFAFYLRNHSDLPAPADIANIIERGNKPPFDRAVYANIGKKQAVHRTPEEWEYIKDYEKFMISGKN